MFSIFRSYYNWLKFGRVKNHIIVCIVAIGLVAVLKFVLPSEILIFLIFAMCFLYLIPLRVLTIGRSARDARKK